MGDVFNQILDGFEEFASITHNERAKSKIDMYRNLFCEDSIKEDKKKEDKNESINDDFRMNDLVNISSRSTEADTEYLKNGNEPKPKVCQKKAGEYVYPPLSLLIRQEEDVYTDF